MESHVPGSFDVGVHPFCAPVAVVYRMDKWQHYIPAHIPGDGTGYLKGRLISHFMPLYHDTQGYRNEASPWRPRGVALGPASQSQIRQRVSHMPAIGTGKQRRVQAKTPEVPEV